MMQFEHKMSVQTRISNVVGNHTLFNNRFQEINYLKPEVNTKFIHHQSIIFF